LNNETEEPAFSFDLSHQAFESFFSMSREELLKDEMEYIYPIQDEITTQTERYSEGVESGTLGANILFKVYDSHSGRDVAKVMLSDDINHDYIEHFLREARLTASLQHPNILPVYDIGINEYGAPFYIMEWLDCNHLQAIIDGLGAGDPKYTEFFTRTRLLDIFVKLCYAVDYAHSRKIVHSNLNPLSIFIGDFGEVFVGDWSRAKSLDDDYSELDDMLEQELISGGAVLPFHGVPGYRAPEQIVEPTSADELSDVYSLGALLYSMLNLRLPVDGTDSDIRQTNIVEGNLLPFVENITDPVPESLQAIVYRAQALNPEDRFENVRELRKAVRAYIHGKDI